ncbi:repeat protein [Moumouvirus goulette]|uniref:Repeat protein n=1 Tax=Moumouvirus goulette TaxID=1247379 RepID=M1PW97_9VIRU|nr:repeat protein [Moumouvirus goulette]AGF85017.1 repeat protein [Moumouvirus goulette]
MSTNYQLVNTNKNELVKLIQNNDLTGFEKLLDNLIDTDYSQVCYTVGSYFNNLDSNNDNEFISALYNNIKKMNNPSDIIVVSAAHIARVDLIEFLIDIGGNINAVDKDGFTPLSSACCFGNYNVVEFLIKNGANINNDKKSDIFKYLCYGQEKICSLLLDHGLIVDLNNKNEINGIFHIIKSGNVSFLNLLLSHGVDLSPINKCLKNKYENDKNNKIIDILIDHDINPKYIHCMYVF